MRPAPIHFSIHPGIHASFGLVLVLILIGAAMLFDGIPFNPPPGGQPRVRSEPHRGAGTAGQSSVETLLLALGRTVWGWRLELVLLAVPSVSGLALAQRLGRAAAITLSVGTVVMLLAVAPSRRLVACGLSRARARRRWYRGVTAARLGALGEELPRIVSARTVPAGDLLTVAVPYGSAVADLQSAKDVLAAALEVRDLRIERDPANARLARVLVVRRDPLGNPRSLRWPAGAAQLSLWDPVPVGIGEDGQVVTVALPERHLLLGGEPGAGKSVALSLLVAAAALDPHAELWLLDGKRVELATWAPLARRSVGPEIRDAIEVLDHLRAEMDTRYRDLLAGGLRKVTPESGLALHVLVCDELAFYLHAGDRKERGEFAEQMRDLVARGRAAGIIVLAATQKPSVDIVPSSLRDLFGFRWALRCATPQASDTILGAGWAADGYSAADIDAAHRGVGYLLHEGGVPVRLKAFHLDDHALVDLARRAGTVRMRGTR